MSNILKYIEIYKKENKYNKESPDYITVDVSMNIEDIINYVNDQFINNDINIIKVWDDFTIKLRKYCNIDLDLEYRHEIFPGDEKYVKTIGIDILDKDYNKEIYLVSENNGNIEKISIANLFLINNMNKNIRDRYTDDIGTFENAIIHIDYTYKGKIEYLTINIPHEEMEES